MIKFNDVNGVEQTLEMNRLYNADRMTDEAVVVKVDNANKTLYTSKELAAVLGYSVRWVVKWRHRIPGAMRVGRQWRFIKKVIDKLDFAKLQNCLK